ncbi:MAG: four helix bundle protein [Patescibacteria group bacterium]
MPIVHQLGELYKHVYQIGKKLSKGDKLGVWSKIEIVCLECLELSITASLLPLTSKTEPLRRLGLKIEVMKRLIRLCCEIKIIEDRVYLCLTQPLQEISKMTAGWYKYANQKERP